MNTSIRQVGFTLVELMIAMIVGAIVIVGAGQLFLVTFQVFHQIDEISRKQEVVVFAANTLVNAYRKADAGYTMEVTRDDDDIELNECSIIDTKVQPSPQPIVGGLARNDGGCDSERFVNDEIQVAGEYLEGYHRFTLDFDRKNGSMETLVFHVMERNKAFSHGSESDRFAIGNGDAIIAGGNINGVNGDLLKGNSTVNSNFDDSNIPDPGDASGKNNYTGYLNNFKSIGDVIHTCDPATISLSIYSMFYCNENISNLSVDGLNDKIIVAEDGISLRQDGGVSVNNLVVIAGGAINISGVNENENENESAKFEGVVWSGENINFSVSGLEFQGCVIAKNGVTVNNASSITSDWNAWELLSFPGHDFSMYERLEQIGFSFDEAGES